MSKYFPLINSLFPDIFSNSPFLISPISLNFSRGKLVSVKILSMSTSIVLEIFFRKLFLLLLDSSLDKIFASKEVPFIDIFFFN